MGLLLECTVKSCSLLSSNLGWSATSLDRSCPPPPRQEVLALVWLQPHYLPRSQGLGGEDDDVQAAVVCSRVWASCWWGGRPGCPPPPSSPSSSSPPSAQTPSPSHRGSSPQVPSSPPATRSWQERKERRGEGGRGWSRRRQVAAAWELTRRAWDWTWEANSRWNSERSRWRRSHCSTCWCCRCTRSPRSQSPCPRMWERRDREVLWSSWGWPAPPPPREPVGTFRRHCPEDVWGIPSSNIVIAPPPCRACVVDEVRCFVYSLWRRLGICNKSNCFTDLKRKHYQCFFISSKFWTSQQRKTNKKWAESIFAKTTFARKTSIRQTLPSVVEEDKFFGGIV